MLLKTKISINTLQRRNMKLKHWVPALIFLFTFSINQSGYSQSISYKDSISWKTPLKTQVSKDFSFTSLHFEGGIYPYASSVCPLYSIKKSVSTGMQIQEVKIIALKTVSLTQEELSILDMADFRNSIDTLSITSSIYSDGKKPFITLNFNPVVKNKQTRKLEKIEAFDIEVKLVAKTSSPKGRTYAANSVLSTGKWYKISTTNEGIHIIRKQDLILMGLNPAITDPALVSIFGNGGAPLAENNATPRLDDLAECAVSVVGGGDGSFDDNDYILFYAKSHIGWNYNFSTHKYDYKRNNFTDYSFYFVTFDANIGLKKRIQPASIVSDPVTKTVTQYSRYFVYEKERVNLAKSGCDWLGETFDYTTAYSFPFRISNLDMSKPLEVNVAVAANSSSNSTFNLNIGSASQSLGVSALTIGDQKDGYVAKEASQTFNFAPTSANFNVNINYTKPTSLSVGWLNRIIVHAKCNLSQAEPQLLIRTDDTENTNEILEYIISNGTTAKVWDITDFNNVKEMPTAINGSNLTFVSRADTTHEFVSFNGLTYYSTQYIGTVENQNLHALPPANMVIIAYPDFISEAQQLQQFHETERGLSVQIVTPNQIYNEFGSGSPDMVAIRDFVKMCYDKNGPNTFKYLLLFGDASYDYRNILGMGQNFVPTYENENSTNTHTSFDSDDFFGLLDDNEGEGCTGLLDIGIGRFVVKNKTEAQQMVDKTIRYCSKTDLTQNLPNVISNFEDWKNMITVIGDDEDGNTHLTTAIKLTNIVEQNYPKFNLDKIFLDAYPQVSNSGGQRYPDVEIAINERMRKGTLLMTYVGHGGEVGWAHERILRVSDILAWQNKFNQPIMFTATCEFTRYDDPERVSAGEMVHLNPNGGAVALFTTSRVAWSSTNDFLGVNFFNNAFTKLSSNQYYRLGELIRISKNLDPGGWSSLRNFVLIGDPSIVLAFPKYNVKTTYINHHSTKFGASGILVDKKGNVDNRDIHVKVPLDTLKALSSATITGIVTDNSDIKLTQFNGEITVTVYDKPSIIRTLGNDPDSPPVDFSYQKNIIFKGKAKVTHGDFEISFIVPKDISYNYGNGKISYYAKCDTADANGSFSDFIVGGYSDHPIVDNTPPDIHLFLNNEHFVNLGLTNENPQFIAQVSDSSGINIMGSTIGHDAVITIDHQTSNNIVVNDYFETELNSYQKGTFHYPLKDLSDGKHTLTFKVWDILNNSAEKSIEFTVVKQANLSLDHVLNYPNPFTTHTNFFFEHNQADTYLDAKIQIFTITGKLVKTIIQNTQMSGFRSEGIPWDGTDDYGDKLAKGIYLYKLSVKSNTGSTAEKIEKLVIL